MKNTNHIGLDKKEADILCGHLNQLLADFQLFYINTRGFHWSIKGTDFFELHVKFEEIYTDALVKIDEIAERILTLGQQPFHSFSAYLEHAQIKEATNISDGKQALAMVMDQLQALITLERGIMDGAGNAGDEGTSALMSDYIREQEKSVWMYAAYLG